MKEFDETKCPLCHTKLIEKDLEKVIFRSCPNCSFELTKPK